MKISTVVLLLAVLGACYSQPTVSLKAYFDAHNKARTNPSYYAGFIQNEYKSKLDVAQNIQTVWRLKFNEPSPAQFDEAITAVNTQTPLSALKMDLGMTYSVYKHVKYLADTLKGLSHSGAKEALQVLELSLTHLDTLACLRTFSIL